MYSCTIDFQMLYEINKVLKDNGYDCSIHTIGGCSCNGVELKGLTTSNRIEVLNLINAYLKTKFMYLVDDSTNENYFQTKSVFEGSKNE